MVSVSKLLCGVGAEGDGLRYDAAEESSKSQITKRKQRRPVVVWNLTKQCNLYCSHCYAAADTDTAPGELSTTEGKRLLDDLAAYGVPVVLFSGGEPLVRYADEQGIRPVLSTNGTVLTRERARELRDAGLQYAGISVDGLPERNDAFRGQDGAFDAAVRGIRARLDAGLKTGLRYTITERNADDLRDVVDLLHEEGVDRFCFYHLDYGGRGADIGDMDLSPDAKPCSSGTTRTLRTSSNTHDASSATMLPNACPTTSSGTAVIRPASESLRLQYDYPRGYIRYS